VNPQQRAALSGHFDRFARAAREQEFIPDQEVAEFMLHVGARWLLAHGVSAANIHTWIDRSLVQPAPQPLTAAARAANDFGGRR
jgi:hypothetical protein